MAHMGVFCTIISIIDCTIMWEMEVIHLELDASHQWSMCSIVWSESVGMCTKPTLGCSPISPLCKIPRLPPILALFVLMDMSQVVSPHNSTMGN